MRLLALGTMLWLAAAPVARGQGLETVERAVPDGGAELPLSPPTLVTHVPATWPPGVDASGTVALELLVDADGRVVDATVTRPLHPALDEAALRAARRLEFVPARLGAEPVAVRVPFDYHFTPAPQRGVLRVLVRERGTRERLAGAQLFDADGLEVGSTDTRGEARLTLPPGLVTLTVVASGHLRATLQQQIVARAEQTVLVRLEVEGVDPFETVTRGERLTTDLGRVALQDAEVREVPGTLGDPLRVVMLMPGVSQVASGVSYPVVRGSLPAATATYVDGVRVPILFHLLLGPSVVHPEAIDRIDFTPGIPGAERGRLMAGTVEARLEEPTDEVRGVAAADLINAGAAVHGTVASTGTKLLASGRVSYTPWLLAQLNPLAGGDVPPEERVDFQADFWDYLARVEQPWSGGATRLLALGASDVVGSNARRVDGLDLAMVTRFHRVDVRDVRPLPWGELELGLGAGTQQAGVLGARGEARLDLLLEQQDVGGRAVWRLRDVGPWSTRVGLEAERLSSATRVGGDANPTPVLARASDALMLGAYAEAEWSALDWSIVAGARGDAYHLVPGLTRWSWDPRLSVRRAFGGDWTVQLSAGSAHQAPTALLPVPVLELAGLEYGLQESWQVDASVAWTPPSGWDVRLNGYASWLPHAIELDLERLLRDVRARGQLRSDPSTTGRALGAELLVRKHLGGWWYGWASYALQRSVRTQRFVTFDARGMPVGERTAELPFAFDQTHVANLAVSLRLPGDWTVGAVVRAQTGRPESGQLSSRTMTRDVDPQSGEPRWRPVDLDQVGRLPAFVRLDLRAAKRWTFDDLWLEASLDLQNASFSQEVLGYAYDRQLNPQTLQPALSRSRISFPVVLPLLGVKAGF